MTPLSCGRTLPVALRRGPFSRKGRHPRTLPRTVATTEITESRRARRQRPRAAAAHYGYQPALDGLRAFAVGSVMLYHASQSWAIGGFLGVDAFFVLSGFLITTLLITEWGSAGRINLGAFWLRRARRLLPALVVVMVGILFYAAIFAGPGRGGEDPVRRLRHAGLFGELEVHLRRAVVLRPVHAAVAVPAHVVARDRRAVLPDLAADRVRGAVVHEVGARTARHRPRDDGGIGRVDGGALLARAGSLTRLLRHRHTRAVAAHGGGRFDPRVPPRPDPNRGHAACAASARGDRRGLHAVALVDAVGTQRCPVPRRVPARVVGRRDRDRVGDPTRPRAARPRAVVVPAALDRHDLVRAVPLALARLPHHHGNAHRPRGQRAPVRAARRHVRLREPLLLPGRTADSPRHLPHPEAGVHRAGAGGGAPGRPGARDQRRGYGPRRARRRARSPRDRRPSRRRRRRHPPAPDARRVRARSRCGPPRHRRTGRRC